MDKSLR